MFLSQPILANVDQVRNGHVHYKNVELRSCRVRKQPINRGGIWTRGRVTSGAADVLAGLAAVFLFVIIDSFVHIAHPRDDFATPATKSTKENVQ